jgi:hypothetical protein
MRRLSYTHNNLSPRSGIASLPAILLLGAIIVEIGIASVFLLSYLNNSVYGTRLSNQALLAANAGINDAVSRVILNKDLHQESYTLTAGGATAEVKICKDTFFFCDGTGTSQSGKHQIVSMGRALTRQHRLIGILSVDPVTGLVVIDSIKDQPL